jgi:hypothetical protein
VRSAEKGNSNGGGGAARDGGGQVDGVFVGKLRNRVGLGFARPWPMGREHDLDADADKNFFYIFLYDFSKINDSLKNCQNYNTAAVHMTAAMP